MRWLLAAATVSLALPALAQDNEAEKLYRAFEKKVLDAKAFKTTFDIKTEIREQMTLKGELTVAAGNKLRLSFEGMDDGGKPLNGIVLCDGKTVVIKSKLGDDDKSEAAHDKMTEYVTGYLIAAGLFVGVEQGQRARPETDPKAMKISGFKSAGKDKVGDRDALLIEYVLEPPRIKGTAKCKLWFDPRTKMPLKRVLEFENDGQVRMRVIETYGPWLIDPALKGDEFTLPK